MTTKYNNMNINDKAFLAGQLTKQYLKKGLDVFSSKKLTGTQVFEGIGNVNLKPTTRVFAEVLRKGHLYKYDLGTNVVLGSLKNGAFTNCYNAGNSFSMANWFFTGITSPNSPTIFYVGTSNTAALASQTGIITPLNPVYQGSGLTTTGNSAIVDSTTGNVIYTIKSNSFAAITSQQCNLSSSITLNEFSFSVTGSSSYGITILGTTGQQTFNRCVSTPGITMNVGDILFSLTFVITIPSLAVTTQTVAMSSQGGLNISGQLGLIGTTASIVGGSVTPAGAATPDTTIPLFPENASATSQFYLNTSATTFPGFNANTTGMSAANAATSTAWSTYVTGSYMRTIIGQWALTNPASNTTFNAIDFTKTGVNGYRLLLTTPQNKTTSQIFNFGLTFSM